MCFYPIGCELGLLLTQYLVHCIQHLLLNVGPDVGVFTREADTWTGVQAATTDQLDRQQFAANVGAGFHV